MTTIKGGSPEGMISKGQEPVDWRHIPKLKKATVDIRKLVQERQEIGSAIKALETRKEEVNSTLLPLIASTGEHMIRVDDWRVTYVETEGVSRIDKVKLVELGVSMGVIRKATIEGKPSRYLKITAIEKEEG